MSTDAKERPSTYDELFPGRFMKAGQFKGKNVTLAIREVYLDSLPTDDGGAEKRPVMGFHKTDKELALNSTNAQCIAAMLGKEPQKWVGHKITLMPDEDYFGKEKVACIRIAGSPELDRDVEVTIKLPRKKPKRRWLRMTGKTSGGTGKTTPGGAAQDVDHETGEVLSQEEDYVAAGPPEREPGEEG